MSGCAGRERVQSVDEQGGARSPGAERGGATTLARTRAIDSLDGAVTHVVDGDTIKVEVRGFETTVRLLGIDTPETRRPGGFVQCFGPAASDRTARLLPVGKSVRLVTDASQDRRDRYGRLLAYVYTTRRTGPTDSINFALVATGYAKVYIYGGRPFRYASEFVAAEARAKADALGLWGEPCRGDTDKREPPPR